MFPQGSITAWKNSVFNSSYLFILNTYLCRLQYSKYVHVQKTQPYFYKERRKSFGIRFTGMYFDKF